MLLLGFSLTRPGNLDVPHRSCKICNLALEICPTFVRTMFMFGSFGRSAQKPLLNSLDPLEISLESAGADPRSEAVARAVSGNGEARALPLQRMADQSPLACVQTPPVSAVHCAAGRALARCQGFARSSTDPRCGSLEVPSDIRFFRNLELFVNLHLGYPRRACETTTATTPSDRTTNRTLAKKNRESVRDNMNVLRGTPTNKTLAKTCESDSSAKKSTFHEQDSRKKNAIVFDTSPTKINDSRQLSF